MAPINIQSQDYRDLLDIIDNLRAQGFDRYVPLPEIIVCGDQSSGKSSVLEAISGLSFPSKDSLCTRFATELVLRRDDVASIAVSIEPRHTRTDAEKQALKGFHADLDAKHPDIGPVIEAAKVAMGLVDGTAVGGRRFSNDVLRIEMSGPTQQHLTLVDLPGLFHAGSADQSADEAPVVRQLVTDYMKRPRSIILAVVSGAYEFANQLATQLARDVDPRGVRTMGLVTKPDMLEEGSDREHAFLKMAANRDVVLQLGWHVLRNRGHKHRDATRDGRDALEKQFFTAPGNPWLEIPSSHLGIGPLRPRLSTILMNQILAQLGTILGDVDNQLRECKQGLARLGTPRGTMLEQRQYLSGVSSRFTELITATVQGNYSDAAFFGIILPGVQDEEEEDTYYRRLRAVVQNRLTEFARDMHRRGQTRVIISDDVEEDDVPEDKIRRTDYIDQVKYMLSKSRGRELPGTFNPLVVNDLFREQCKNWAGLAEGCIESILRVSLIVIEAGFHHVAVGDMAGKLIHLRIRPTMAQWKKEMLDEVGELLEAHNKGHPITYNHYLTENVQKARNDRYEKRIRKVLEKYNGHTLTTAYIADISAYLMGKAEADMARLAASDAIDYMEAYYKVALKRFVDDFSVLAVEQCLLNKLPTLFTPETIYTITDKDIAHLAGEQEHTVAERARLADKLACLEKCHTKLHRLDKHASTTSGQATMSCKIKDVVKVVV